jgi:hypothetical protein
LSQVKAADLVRDVTQEEFLEYHLHYLEYQVM